MDSNTIRRKFLEFFKEKGHAIIPSASLVPSDTDPTVLFTTAGMQQFKNYYLNPKETKDARITTSQKCIRTIDIEEVGDDTHLTFFEMLGNFSFGYPNKPDSYFKKEAIQYAWEFLTEVLNIDKSRIYATYFEGHPSTGSGQAILEDKESLEILKKIPDLKEIKPQGLEDNFWSLWTENSPGGPTVEFYVDGIEIWNCVFNEYTLINGKHELSKNRGVDTGMGLERLVTVLNSKNNVYETDLFAPIIEKIETFSPTSYKLQATSYRIIADHIKASVFIISDGVAPSNTGAGYVLRRLIRRAVRYGKLLNLETRFPSEVAEVVIDIYKGIYPELEKNKKKILEELNKEEEKFGEKLKIGEKILKKRKEKDLTGKFFFDMYQTYGFPFEMTKEFYENHGYFIDDKIFEEFKNLIEKHQELSKTASAGMFKGGLADSGEQATKYHTATHLLLASLREVLGGDLPAQAGIMQKGSNINAERLRFDFSYPEKLTDEQKQKVEDLVNEKIKENLPVEMSEMSKNEALKIAKVSFDESKYGDVVKVYKIGSFSVEVCGGPHVKRTGELGKFKITKEESSSSGVRRIKAVLE